MSSHVVSPPGAGRLRGGTWRYAAPNAVGAGAVKFRENLRRLGGEDLLPVDRTRGADSPRPSGGPAEEPGAPSGVGPTGPGTPPRPDRGGRRPGRPRTVR